MSIEIVESPGPIDAALLEGFERRLPATLPGDFRSFLLSTNGGFSHSYSLDYTSTAFGEQSTAIFLWGSLGAPFKQNYFMSIEGVSESAKGLIPSGTIPIASPESGHELILLSLNRENYGAILHYDDETAPEKATSKVAASFAAFSDRLKLVRRRS